METVNLHEAKIHLSRLVEKAANGESFIIAKNGKPMVKVIAIDAPEKKEIKHLGFLEGQISVPEDFDRMFEDEIDQMFHGTE